MGHDISLISEKGKELDYLRMPIWFSFSSNFYRALKLSDFNGGASGIGKSSIVSSAQIKDAIRILKMDEKDYLERMPEAINFLERCLRHMKMKRLRKMKMRFD